MKVQFMVTYEIVISVSINHQTVSIIFINTIQAIKEHADNYIVQLLLTSIHDSSIEQQFSWIPLDPLW